MTLSKKIDFTVLFTCRNANPNGDPLYGNRPRINLDGHGEVSDVCIKRKIRNRMMDMGLPVFVQSDERRVDEYKNLSDRAKSVDAIKAATKAKDKEAYAKAACEQWIDVRSFGQVFAFKTNKSEEEKGVSVGVRGPVSVQTAISINQVDASDMQITKSVNSEPGDKKGSDTMGMKSRIDHAAYRFNGSINCQLAEKTGFTKEDAEVLKTCLRTLFENDCSSARPDGSMEVLKVYWWEHNCSSGQYSSAKVHRSIQFKENEETHEIKYELHNLDGLTPEVYEGL